jgi:hypothetical protein
MKRGENLWKHGLSGTPEHRSWCGMITRCYGSDPSRGDFHLYQGAGIQVCHRWRESFLNFLADMGKKPTSRHSIERKNSSGNYEPGNCVWATSQQQARNTTRNRWITANGRTLTLVEWSQLTGLKQITIWCRLDTGWSEEKAVNTPVTKTRRRDSGGTFLPL